MLVRPRVGIAVFLAPPQPARKVLARNRQAHGESPAVVSPRDRWSVRTKPRGQLPPPRRKEARERGPLAWRIGGGWWFGRIRAMRLSPRKEGLFVFARLGFAGRHWLRQGEERHLSGGGGLLIQASPCFGDERFGRRKYRVSRACFVVLVWARRLWVFRCVLQRHLS